MNQSTKLTKKISKDIKSDNFCLRKVGISITKLGAIEKSNIVRENDYNWACFIQTKFCVWCWEGTKFSFE